MSVSFHRSQRDEALGVPLDRYPLLVHLLLVCYPMPDSPRSRRSQVADSSTSPLEDSFDMRIAFNAQLLSEPHTGTGRYVYNLLAALGRLDPSVEYHNLSAHELLERPETPPSMRWETAPMSRLAAQRPGVEKLVWEQRTFPRAARQVNADLIHVPYFAPPLRTFGIPSLVSILDVIPQR